MDLWLTFADNLSTIRFLKGAIYRLSTGDLSGNAARPIPPNSPDQSVMNKEVLARDVVDIYERNIEIVASLAERYSFEALFYLQPTIFENST